MIRYLCGVRGAGKTALVPHLVAANTGCVVVDMDEVLVEGHAMGIPIAFDHARDAWPAYNRHWVLIASLIARSTPLLLLGPLLPAEWAAAGGDPSTPFALLDCPDDVRTQRLHARGWPDEWSVDAIADAADARAVITQHISTACAIDETVAAIVAWSAT
ncbi:MAG: hypothetical protein V7636_2302 [Actinomycetota bacterium]